ncbi:MAG: hypothetical protein WBC75_09410, partial [Dehalococcoidales bacterium]
MDSSMQNELSTIRQDINGIRQSLEQLVRLDEKMVSQQEGMARLGGRLDRVDDTMGKALDRLQRLETLDKARSGVTA